MTSLFSGMAKDIATAETEASNILRTLKGIGLTERISPLFDIKLFETNLIKYREKEIGKDTKGNKRGKANRTMGAYGQYVISFIDFIILKRRQVEWGVPFQNVYMLLITLKNLKKSFNKKGACDDRMREEEDVKRLKTYLHKGAFQEY